MKLWLLQFKEYQGFSRLLNRSKSSRKCFEICSVSATGKAADEAAFVVRKPFYINLRIANPKRRGCIFITTLQYCKNAHIPVHETNKLMLKYA